MEPRTYGIISLSLSLRVLLVKLRELVVLPLRPRLRLMGAIIIKLVLPPRLLPSLRSMTPLVRIPTILQSIMMSLAGCHRIMRWPSS
jgi:hypothetical protein